MKFAKWIFLIAGIYGILTVAPLYFLEGKIARASGPIGHPEYFYGFIGMTLVWQVAFLAIGRNPIRWRPAMPLAVLEKLSFAPAVFVLHAQHRVTDGALPFAVIDLMWGILFAMAFVRTPKRH